MQDELYIDGISEITVTGPIVRINLMSLSATEQDEKGQPKAVFRQRIVIPIDGFANAVDLMQKALAGLVEAGAVRRVGAEPHAPAAASLSEAGVTLTAPRAPNGSPNFN